MMVTLYHPYSRNSDTINPIIGWCSQSGIQASLDGTCPISGENYWASMWDIDCEADRIAFLLKWGNGGTV